MKKIISILDKNKNIGIDTMVFIYLFEENKKYADICETIFDRISHGKNVAHISNLSLFEVLAGSYKKGLDPKDYIQLFLNMPNLKIYPTNVAILNKAAQIRAKFGIRPMDSICYANAIYGRAKVFITNDRELQKIKDKSIKIIVIEDYLAG
ncbi:type II toxin-antitoxin system VapC family toxin [Candidatus Microgenomates bacterium]|nr:type II toxin-antitoxin system VapC family toxin [Candidatus Microgenomates bacterium]